MLRIFTLGLLAVLLLGACGGPAAPGGPATNAQGLPVITVYKSPG